MNNQQCRSKFIPKGAKALSLPKGPYLAPGGSLKAAGFGDGEPRAQNVLFMQNEPNFKKRQMNLTLYKKRYYAKLDTCSHAKNEPKTNPKRTQFSARRSPRVCSIVPETPNPPRLSSLVYRAFTRGLHLYAVRCPLDSIPAQGPESACRGSGFTKPPHTYNVLMVLLIRCIAY